MAFKMEYKLPPPPSNKGYGGNVALNCIDSTRVCYRYDRGDKGKGFVLNPVIDFIVITIPVTDPDIQGLIATALSHDQMNVSEESYLPFHKGDLPKMVKGLYQHYTHGIKITSFSGLCAIQAKPTNKFHRFLKLTLIPSRWTPVDVDAFWTYLLEISGGAIDADYVAEYGSVRRLDWAIDFLNVDATDLLLQKNSANKRKSFAYMGAGGGIETYYVGPNEQKLTPQNSKAYIYDKLTKDTQKGITPEFNALHVRFEVRLRKHQVPDGGLKALAQLSAKIKNRFSSYSLTDFRAAMPKGDNAVWFYFGDSCKVRGVEAALAMLSASEQDNFMQALEKAQESCWLPDDLWKATRKYVWAFLSTSTAE